MRNRFPTVALMLSLSIGFGGGTAFAQFQTGNLYGTVMDGQGAPLPGAEVTLTGPGAPQIQVTNDRGQFRFLNLAPGSYALEAELEGYSTARYPDIAVAIGRNTTIEVTMNAAAEEDTGAVTAEAPLLDARRSVTTVQGAPQVPTARDPWALLQSTPGVLEDRINVGGKESRCSSAPLLLESHTEAGQAFLDASELIATAMATAGLPPEPLAFAGVEQPAATAGPLDAQAPEVRLLPRRGTNDWQASGSLLGGGLAAESTVPGPAGAVPGDRVDAVRSGDGQIGGPLRKDRFWLWSEAGFEETDRAVLGGQTEKRSGTSGRAKLNAQLGDNVSAVLAASRGHADGSGAGAVAGRAPETTWNEDGRETVWAAETTAIANPNFYATASFGELSRRLSDRPRQAGGAARISSDGVARGSWFELGDAQRTQQAQLSSTLYTGGSTYQEIVFGGGWRAEQQDRRLTPPGPLVIAGSDFGLGDGLALAELWRGGTAGSRSQTRRVWIQDRLSSGSWTVMAGLHADGQDLGLAGGPRPWTLAPRFQLNKRLDTARDTQLWLSLARFTSRLAPRAAWHRDPGAAAVLRSLFADRNGDLALDPGESVQLVSGEGLDPVRPDIDPDAVDPHLRPEITDEAVLGFHRELTPDFELGLRATWQRTRHLLDERFLVRDPGTGEVFAATSADWIPAGRLTGTLPDGTPYDAPVWDLRPGLQWTGGTLLANGDRRQDDFGLSLTWDKRLANRWLSQGRVTWHDGRQRLGPAFRRFDDPTNTLGSGDDEGRPIAEAAAVAPHDALRFPAARWSFHATGLVVLRGGLNLAVGLDGREGFPLPYYRQVVRERAGLARVQLTGRPDALRTADPVTLGAALEKELTLRGGAGVTVSLEATNLLNAGSVLARELDLGSGRAALADETLTSRTLRLAVRVSRR